MKPMAWIPLLIAGGAGAAALLIRLIAPQLNPLDPLFAGAIATLAALLGMLPILKLQDKDPASVVQRALIGTVLHVLAIAGLAGMLIFTNVVVFRLPFIMCLMGAYWFSLTILVWQLRRVIVALTANPAAPPGNLTHFKVQN